ncbi:MAG: M56 family metallopeptidase, partial [Ruminiclostridium sp.]|nr:M56 family metallopeptidase [Ruminiclostridium sp.]
SRLDVLPCKQIGGRVIGRGNREIRRRVADAIRIEGNLYETDRVDTPFVCGFVKPRIYLPVGLDPAHVPHVVRHEQAHIKRLDHLTKPLFWLALCLHWFNPVLWLAYILFCRDLETACDQRVIQDLDRQNTADYAAALLCLGREKSLPQAVPLAFGEENAKSRVKGVLNYKKPRFVLVTVILCVGAGFLLLGSSEGYLEGHKVTDSCTWAEGSPIHFPQELQAEAVQMVKPYLRTKEEIPRPETSPLGQDGLTHLECNARLPNRYYTLYREDGRVCLQVSEYVGDQSSHQYYALDPAFSEKYEAWLARLDQFLWEERPDALYATAGPLTKQAEAESLLHPLWQLFGTYTIEMDTSAEPYPISVQLQRIPGLHSQQQALQEYLRLLSLSFQTLATNTEPIQWSRENTLGDWAMTPSFEGAAQSKEEFRTLYRQMETAASRLRQYHTRYYATQALYLAPDLPGVGETVDLSALYQHSGWGIDASGFSADLFVDTEDSHQVLAEDRISHDPLYDCAPLSPGEFPTEANLDLDRYQVKYRTIVYDNQGQDTGYRVYELDDELYFAHYRTDGSLEYLFQASPEAAYW